jgi:predicted peptidase
MTTEPRSSREKDPGHPYAQTQHISFSFFDQRESNAPFGYEHYVSLPPAYEGENSQKRWPLILFLHGAGESQRGRNQSYLSLRHGIPKVILCYDKMRSYPSTHVASSISIPQAERLRKSKQAKQGDKSEEPVSREVCELLAENFITVTPSLDMEYGYGWNASILSALLDEIVDRYRVDIDEIHVSGFSMGAYGTWDLAMHSPRRFASLMPICGGGDPLRVSHIKHIPHW